MLRITSVRQGEADPRGGGGGGGATLMSTELRTRNHYSALEHIDFVIGHGAREFRCRAPGSLNARSDANFARGPVGKRALESPCHVRIATGPQNTTDHTYGPAEPSHCETQFSAVIRSPGRKN